jgi:hypothetical protein
MLVLLGALAYAQHVPVPFVNQPLVPASVRPGHKAFLLTVNGTGFSKTASVLWNGSPRVTEVLSSSSLQAEISADDVKKAGTASIAVVNPGRRVSQVIYFTVREPSKSVHMTQTAPINSAGTVIVADFNNDGIPDVAVGISQNGGQSGAIEVYFGDGKGKFRKPVQTTISGVPYTMLAADFNGDGKTDLAVNVNPGEGSTLILLGNGDGTFNQVSSEYSGAAVAAGDFNGDGFTDLIEESSFGEVTVLLSNGDGTFQYVYFNGEETGIPAVGDFNQDGILDLAFSYDTVDVYLGNGDGTFQSAGTYRVSQGGNLQAADVNGDGKLDLITSGVTVLLGHGDGTFQIGSSFYVGGYYGWTIADFNGDGKLDLIIPVISYGGEAQTLQVFLGDGKGNFGEPIVINAGNQVGADPGLGIADFNGDGKLDAIISTSTSNHGLWELTNPILLKQK